MGLTCIEVLPSLLGKKIAKSPGPTFGHVRDVFLTASLVLTETARNEMMSKIKQYYDELLTTGVLLIAK